MEKVAEAQQKAFEAGKEATQKKDCYQVLGIARGSSAEEITLQYTTLLQQHADNKEKLEDIKKAYEILSNEKTRDEHDALLRARDAMRCGAAFMNLVQNFGSESAANAQKAVTETLEAYPQIKRPVVDSLHTAATQVKSALPSLSSGLRNFGYESSAGLVDQASQLLQDQVQRLETEKASLPPTGQAVLTEEQRRLFLQQLSVLFAFYAAQGQTAAKPGEEPKR